MESNIPPFLIPQCDNLHFLVNRAALSLLADGGIPSEDIICRIRPHSRKSVGWLLRYAESIIKKSTDYSILSSYYVSKGERFEYLFTLVRCGKCAKCRHAKQIDMINRVQMESSCYQYAPYMVTLTYSQAYLPLHRVRHLYTNTLYYKDIQDFFKRLRIKWQRQGYEVNLRYLVAGEYGKLGRPHYHLLLWNIPFSASPFGSPSELLGHRKVVHDIFTAWSMCEKQAFQCEPAQDGAGAYVSKYLTKSALFSLKRDGRTPPFLHQSTRDGGIGAPCVKRSLRFLLDNPILQEFTYRSQLGSVQNVPITSFIKSYCYKSASRQIPQKYKDMFYNLRHLCRKMYSLGMLDASLYDFYLQYYSRGYLHYYSEQPEYVAGCSTLKYILSKRLENQFATLLQQMDNFSLDIDLKAYNAHNQACIPLVNQVGNYAGKESRYKALAMNQQAKEYLP